MIRTRKAAEPKLMIGGDAHIDLLPPEVAAGVKAKSTRRRLAGLVLLCVVLVAGGYSYSSLVAQQSELALTDARMQAAAVLGQQADYIEVLGVQGELDTVTAAQAIGTSTEVDWQTYMDAVTATLPEGVLLTGFSMESATPLLDFTPATAPLQGERVANLSFTVIAPDLPTLQAWLDSLVTLDGFVDASLGSAVLQVEEGVIEASVIMHIDADAFSYRFIDPAVVAELAAQKEEN